MRIVFDDELQTDIYDVKFFTDAPGRQNSGEYGIQITVLNDEDFTPSGNKPIFDIICLNDVTLQFRVDKIR